MRERLEPHAMQGAEAHVDPDPAPVEPRRGRAHGSPAPATTVSDVAAGAVVLALWSVGLVVPARALRDREER